jgi:hypothetical protein
VDAFTASLQCETATLDLQGVEQFSKTGGLHNAPLFTFSLSTKDCTVLNRTVIGGYYYDPNYVGDDFVFDDSWGNVDAVSCSQNASDVRILVSVGLISYNISWHEDLDQNKSVVVSTLPEMYHLRTSTNLFCVPQYGLRSAQANYTTNSDTGARQVTVSEPSSAVVRPLEGVVSSELSQAIMESIDAATDAMAILYPDPNYNVQIVNGPGASQGGFFPTHSDAFFTTMTQQYPPLPAGEKSSWFDPQRLETEASRFFGSVSAQFASQYLRKDVDDRVPGTSAIIEPRLVMSTGIFYAIEGLLVFFACAMFAVLWLASRGVTPLDPASVGGTTAMLCFDTAVIDRLPPSAGTHTLTGLRDHFSILTSVDRATSTSSSQRSKYQYTSLTGNSTSNTDEKETWWRPLVLQPFVREALVSMPFLAIVALEITLHFSRKNNGLATIENSHRDLSASRLVPAVFFATIQALQASLAFNVALMTPFSVLRNGSAKSAVSLFDNPLGRFSIGNLWSSARKGQIALFCAVLMTTISFFMVTVSSGLFVTGDYTHPTNLTLHTWFQTITNNNDSAIDSIADKYNLSKPLHFAQDNGAIKVHLITNSIVELNLSYP